MDIEAFPITEFFLFLESQFQFYCSLLPPPFGFVSFRCFERERERERECVCVWVWRRKKSVGICIIIIFYILIYILSHPPIVLLFSVRDQNCSFLNRICFKRERESMFHEKGTAEIGKGGEGGRRKEEGGRGRGRGRGKHFSLSLSLCLEGQYYGAFEFSLQISS